MRFQVPQFIEVEDKVVGPLTFKQFVYLAGGGGLAFLLYVFLPLFIALPLIGCTVALTLALAFYKHNNKAFSFLLEAFLRYHLTHKLYIWKKTDKKPVRGARATTPESTVYVPKLSNSKLRDLSWSLDITDPSEPLG